MKTKICFTIILTLILSTFMTFAAASSLALEESVDLTALTPTASSVGWGELCINKDLNGGKINIQGDDGKTVTFDKGIVAHASSRITYDVSGYTSETVPFTAYIGADNNPNNQTTGATSMIFIIQADGAEIYRSELVTYTTPAEYILCPIPKGTQRLTLITDSMGNNNGDHSAWGSPTIEKDASMLENFKDIYLSSEKEVLKVGEEHTLDFSILNYANESYPAKKVTFSSSDTSVLTVSDSGAVKALKKGSATVTLDVITNENGESHKKTIQLTVADSEEKSFDISSPEGLIKVNIELDSYGIITYTVKDKDGKSYLEPSLIGIKTDAGNFSNAFEFVSATPVKTVEESYDLHSGKVSHVDSVFNESTMTFKRNGFIFDLIFRLYDDGFGYRYVIKSDGGSIDSIKVIEEVGTFTIPDNSLVSAQPISSLDSYYNYEVYFEKRNVKGIEKSCNYIAKPALFKINNSTRYMLISEADLYSQSFIGSALEPIGNNTFKLCAAPERDEVNIKDGFTSPWRYAICGTLETIVESNLTENLNPPAPDGDYSWVKTGVCAWSWLSEGYNGQGDPDVIKKYIDFAAEMNWGYYILDEGWLPSGRDPYSKFYSWFDEVAEYAEEKGVGLIGWVYSPNVKKNQDGTFDLSFIESFAKQGIKGIKIDFFDSESQWYMDMYRQLYDECAEHKILLNCHGSNIPTGERRTYPFVVNREAVMGEEYGGGIYGNAMFWPYLRNVVGPMDITPAIFSNSGYTTVFQMAVNIMFECGTPCMSGSPSQYTRFSEKSFYQDLPTSWDEIQFISGNEGTKASIARRKGDTWYAAAMANSGERKGSMPLEFLGDGEYTAIIYEQKSVSTVKTTTKLVTSSDVLEYTFNANDAYLVKFIKNDSSVTTPTPSTTPTPAPKPSVTPTPETASPVTVTPEDTSNETAVPENNGIEPMVIIVIIAAVVAVALGVVAFVTVKKSKKE